MLHARTDYSPIQDPRPNGIAEDEPVMLFRSRDALAPLVLEAYANLLRHHTSDRELVRQVELHAARMRAWQSVNGKHMPDVLPHHYLQEGESSPCLTESDAVEYESIVIPTQECETQTTESVESAELLTTDLDDAAPSASDDLEDIRVASDDPDSSECGGSTTGQLEEPTCES